MREPEPAQVALMLFAVGVYFTAAALYFVWLIFRPKQKEEDDGNDAT